MVKVTSRVNQMINFKLLVFFSLILSSVSGQTLKKNFYLVKLAQGFEDATSITFLGENNILVAEKCGKIKILRKDSNVGESFYVLNTTITGERGIHNILYHSPGSFLYVYYTKGDGTRNRLSRIKILNGKPGQEEILLETDLMASDAIFHNGGGLAIYNGKIYIAIGEQYGDAHKAYDYNSYVGKLLRLNLDGNIPEDNPNSRKGSKINQSIWSYGFRNPFNLDIDLSNGRIFIADVGYSTWEEVNDATYPMLHYGWPFGEGSIAHYNPNIPFKDPIYKYPNQASVTDTVKIEDKGCAISSGIFFRSNKTNYPFEYQGEYFFSDVCSGWIKCLDPETNKVALFATDMPPGTLGMKLSPQGDLYYINYNQGTLNKIIYDTIKAPHFLNDTKDVWAALGDTINLQVNVAGDSETQIIWSKGGENFARQNNTVLSLNNVTTSAAGVYKIKLRNKYGADSAFINLILRKPHKSNLENIQLLLQKNTCTTCHSMDKKLIGPSFVEIAKKNYSAEKIVDLIYNPDPKNWPDYPAMTALPQVSKSDALKIAGWIRSLKK